MTILYLIPGMYRAAGMERVLANKANWFAAQGHEIIIATTDQRNRPSAFRMNPSIRQTDLDINYEENNGGSFADKLIHYPGKQLRHRKALKELLLRERPDIVISMYGNDAAFLPGLVTEINRSIGRKCSAAQGIRKAPIRTVLEIHFSRFKRIQYGRKGIWALADRFRSWNDLRIVKRFDRFVVLTEEDAGYWGALQNLRVIPNARTFTVEKPAALENKMVIAAGRYNSQKQFEALIDAWSLLAREFSDWTLRIAGDGEDKAFLERKIADYRIQDKVVLGPEKDMKAAYLNSSILAMSSRYEGLPMVLLEAQACGLPIVSYACKCGPKDVITDGVDGYLVEEGNVTDLADKLFSLMADADLRKSMGEAAFKSSERYDEESVMARWDSLFNELLQS